MLATNVLVWAQNASRQLSPVPLNLRRTRTLSESVFFRLQPIIGTYYFCLNIKIYFQYLLLRPVVARTQQGRQREPSVKTLLFPLSAEFWRHCVLSGRTQRLA